MAQVSGPGFTKLKPGLGHTSRRDPSSRATTNVQRTGKETGFLNTGIPRRLKSPDAEQVELRGFNRTLAEMQWLLLALILVYLVTPAVNVDVLAIAVACGAFALMIIGFRYFNLFTDEARWKLVTETLAMIGLIAFVIWQVGEPGTPLFNLYLVPIVFSGLTLGRGITLAIAALISLLYLTAVLVLPGGLSGSYATFGTAMFHLAPFLLVAYLTSMIAANMNVARRFLQDLSETDGMTGLANMRAFHRNMDRITARAQRDGSEWTVMMIDADYLKEINDRYGHTAGNQWIQCMVETLRKELRGYDLVARYGGDEFIVLLPNTGEDVAREVAERVRRSIAETSLEVAGERVASTVSIGLATYPHATRDVEQVIEVADQAMYQSKKAGRNRVTGRSHVTEHCPPSRCQSPG